MAIIWETSKLDWQTFQAKYQLENSKPCYMQNAEWDCLDARKLSTFEVIRRYWNGVKYNGMEQ